MAKQMMKNWISTVNANGCPEKVYEISATTSYMAGIKAFRQYSDAFPEAKEVGKNRQLRCKSVEVSK